MVTVTLSLLTFSLFLFVPSSSKHRPACGSNGAVNCTSLQSSSSVTGRVSGNSLLDALLPLLQVYHRRLRAELPTFKQAIQLESIRFDQTIRASHFRPMEIALAQHEALSSSNVTMLATDEGAERETGNNMTRLYDSALSRYTYIPRIDHRWVIDDYISANETERLRKCILAITEELTVKGGENALGVPSKHAKLHLPSEDYELVKTIAQRVRRQVFEFDRFIK